MSLPEPDAPGHSLTEHEEAWVQRILLVQESLLHAGNEQGAQLIGVAVAEFCRYLMAVHGLPRREKGYGLTGDPNRGYELVPAEELQVDRSRPAQ